MRLHHLSLIVLLTACSASNSPDDASDQAADPTADQAAAPSPYRRWARTGEPTPAPSDAPADQPSTIPPEQPTAPTTDAPTAPTTEQPAPTTSASLDAAIPKTGLDETLIAQAVFEATNAARAGQGLGPYLYCDPCQRAAQQHADDMVRLDFFSHENPDPALATPGLRLKAQGLTGFSGWAENIASYPGRGQTYRSFAKLVLDAWMNSSGHRANILSTSMTHLGAACALDEGRTSQQLRCVQDFVRLSTTTR